MESGGRRRFRRRGGERGVNAGPAYSLLLDCWMDGGDGEEADLGISRLLARLLAP